MLSSTFAGSYKHSRRCHCKIDKAWTITRLWLKEYKTSPHYRHYATPTNKLCLNKKHQDALKARNAPHQLMARNWIQSSPRSLAIETESAKSKPTVKENREDYNAILSVALDQSNGPITQSLVDSAFNFLRKGNPELAWECYKDITSRDRQRFISREQYKQLIKSFNHTKANHEQGLEYILTLVEDMKQLGYQVGRKEKLLVMRLLGLNGNMSAMEKVFEDLCKEQLLVATDLAAAQKPFNIMLSSYNEHAYSITPEIAAEKSMRVYGEMLDYNIQPGSGTTRLLMDNIRRANNSDEMVEKVWSWVWAKIGMNVGGKTKELEPSLYRDMVLYFASVGRPEYALEINDIMTKKKIPRSLRMMTALIHKVGRSGNVDRAMELFNEMVIVDGFSPSIVTFNAVIDIHAHKKPQPDTAGANRIFNMLTEVGLQPDEVTFSTMIDMYAKKGDLENLKKLFYEMTRTHKITPNPYTFSSAIECFMKLDDRQSARNVLRLLQKQADRRAAPAREAYNLMFKGLVEGGYIKEALELLQEMTKKHSYLEAKTFTPLLSYFAKQGDTSGAHQVASMMTKANVKPTAYTYSILLVSHAKAGDIEGAENVFNMFKQKFKPNTYVYNAMLYLYTNRNEMDKVLYIYKRMSKAYVPANEFTYGILMNFYAKRKELKAVEALLDTMLSNNIKPGVVCYTMLMQSYFESNRPEEAHNVLKRMVEEGLQPSDVTMSIFMKGCIDSDELGYAESILDEAIEKAQDDKRSHSLLKDSNLVSEQTYVQKLPETLEDVLERSRKTLPTHSLSPYLFTPVLAGYTKAQAFDKAKRLIKTMDDLSIPFTVPTYTAIMDMYKREKKYDSVEALWKGLYEPYEGQTVVETLDADLPTIPRITEKEEVPDLLTFEIEQVPTAPVSNFALSIYIDALTDQRRFDVIQTLWSTLSEQAYVFDEQSMNRYIVSLIESKQVDEACRMVTENLWNGKDSLSKHIRKRDDLFISNDNPLHTRTCLSFAEFFELPGYRNMGEPRLRTTVTEKIRDYVHQKNIEIEKNI